MNFYLNIEYKLWWHARVLLLQTALPELVLSAQFDHFLKWFCYSWASKYVPNCKLAGHSRSCQTGFEDNCEHALHSANPYIQYARASNCTLSVTDMDTDPYSLFSHIPFSTIVYIYLQRHFSPLTTTTVHYLCYFHIRKRSSVLVGTKV